MYFFFQSDQFYNLILFSDRSDSEEAQNEPDTVQSQTPSDSINSSSPSDKRPVKQASTSSGPRSAPKTPDGDIDYDALYEDENENEGKQYRSELTTIQTIKNCR